MSTMNYIVGSGVTGMTAALLLAQQGEKVTILEASPRPAPLLRGFSRAGMHFDTGVHCVGGLGENGLLRRWLKVLAVWPYLGEEKLYTLREEFQLYQKDASHSSYNYFPSSRHELQEAICQQFGEHVSNSFMKMHKAMDAELRHSPYTNPEYKEEPHFTWEASQSLLAALTSYNLPPLLEYMVKTRCLLYGVRPEDASFQEYSFVGGLFFDSLHGILGGGKTLMHAFLQALDEVGVTIRCGAKLARIHHKDKNVTGLELVSGEKLACSRCIFTGHPKQLTHCVGKGPLRPAFYGHIEAMPETATAFMLFGETKSDYLRQRIVYLLPEKTTDDVLTGLESQKPNVYVAGGEGIASKDGQGMRYPFFAIIPTDYDFSDGNIKPRSTAYRQWKKSQTERMRLYIESRLPELGTITMHDSASPLTMQDWICGSSGSLYGLAHTKNTIPLLPVTRLGGLFLAGQHILLPGILGGIISAALAVGFATGHHNVLHEFRTCKNSA